MPTLSFIQTLAVWILPVLLAITLHEAAHAWAAHRCGDSTAKMLGRLSMNPLRHVDLVGTLLVPLAVAVLSNFQFVFGWAKPVPISWRKLNKPRRDMALVAAAGPASNFIMALLWATLLKIGLILNPATSILALYFVLTGQAGILINLVLAFLNLLPIPPLDGSRVLTSFLSPKHAFQYNKLEPYGFYILLALLLTHVLNMILSPLILGGMSIIAVLFNLR
jgi:Zn-dependent protease